MSDMITELLGVTSEQAVAFFFKRLKDEAFRGVTQTETLYVAEMLAHFAQTSRSNQDFMSPSGSLYDILDSFVLPGLTPEGFSGLNDPEILEIAGSHTLLLVGFFRDQMKKTHNLEWYDHLGSSFFEKASDRLPCGKKAYMLQKMAENFPVWTMSCRNMSRTLRYERYLLKF